MPMVENLALRPTDIFWGEITPTEHLVQFYPDEQVFLDTLESFVVAGIAAGESVIIIATPLHLQPLTARLIERGIDVASATANDQLLRLDAAEILSQFMVNGWPDEDSFRRVVATILHRAKSRGQRVRAFGEMVALLWAQGNNVATVRLEHLWHGLCREESFSLFCAYPKCGFTQDASTSIKEICDTHSRIV